MHYAKLYYSFVLLIIFISCSYGQNKSNRKCEEYVRMPVRISRSLNVPQIVGGDRTKVNEFPHMVALGYINEHERKIEFQCGGTLISDEFVLTAAHCVNHRNFGPVKIARLGATNLRNGGKDYRISKIIRHPDYKPPSQYHDIALLKLNNKVTFSNSITPACLNTATDITPRSSKVTAIGWGRTDFAGPLSTDLLKVDLNLFPHNQCKQIYRDVPKQKLSNGISDLTQICAGGDASNEKDTCQGDSGGPLVVKTGIFYIIAGVTSFGKACGLSNIPGVYTRVSSYVPWIEKIVWP